MLDLSRSCDACGKMIGGVLDGVTNGLNHSTRMKCGDLIFLHDKREIICFNRISDPPETAPYNPNNQKRKTSR
jgi:hypothetical protein